jgi:hypothetical protein
MDGLIIDSRSEVVSAMIFREITNFIGTISVILDGGRDISLWSADGTGNMMSTFSNWVTMLVTSDNGEVSRLGVDVGIISHTWTFSSGVGWRNGRFGVNMER